MLFQRLYNWVKYKMLPPSSLQKNRLFLERDSKKKRIFSNFGLVFRNSKWGSYRQINIVKKVIVFFFKLILLLFLCAVIFFLILYYNYYLYIKLFIYNTISYLFWITNDGFDYFIIFSVSVFTSLFSFLYNNLYSFFFFNNFSRRHNLERKYLELRHYNNFAYSVLPPKHISKHDLNWVFYSWIQRRSTIPPISRVSDKFTEDLEKLFETKIDSSWWQNYCNFFYKLYKSNYLAQSSSSYFLKSSNLDIINFFINNKKIDQKNFFYQNQFLLNVNSNFKNYDVISTLITKHNPRLKWNLQHFDSNSDLSYLNNKKIGLFYLNNLNYEKFNNLLFKNKESFFLNFDLVKELNSNKWNRWLYKYSLLHRKLLKNSHKNTITKKLISSGFYDNNFFNRNLWNSEYFSDLFNNKDKFAFFFLSFYKEINNYAFKECFLDYDFKSNNSFSNTNRVPLNNLKFFENSYFWFLKRFFFFNTLPANFINLTFSLKNQNHNNQFFKFYYSQKEFFFFY